MLLARSILTFVPRIGSVHGIPILAQDLKAGFDGSMYQQPINERVTVDLSSLSPIGPHVEIFTIALLLAEFHGYELQNPPHPAQSELVVFGRKSVEQLFVLLGHKIGAIRCG